MHKTNLKIAMAASAFLALCIFTNIILEEGFEGTVLLAAFAFSVGFDIALTMIIFIGLAVNSYIAPIWEASVKRASKRAR